MQQHRGRWHFEALARSSFSDRAGAAGFVRRATADRPATPERAVQFALTREHPPRLGGRAFMIVAQQMRAIHAPAACASVPPARRPAAAPGGEQYPRKSRRRRARSPEPAPRVPPLALAPGSGWGGASSICENDNTSVGRSLPRNSRFSACTNSSSAITIDNSQAATPYDAISRRASSRNRAT